jgi:HlyD family secretion protein
MDAVLDWLQTLLAASLALFAPAEAPEGVYYGYVEADYERIAPLNGGTLTELLVARGDTVQAGQLIARFDDANERAVVAQAQARVAETEARVAQAQAQLADLQKGRRALEIEALIAQRAQAAAALALSESTYARQRVLVADGVVPAETLDNARAAFDRDTARIAEIDAQIEAAQLGARGDQVRGAEAALAASEAALAAAIAGLAQAEWRLDQRRLLATTDAVVTETLYAAGETVPPASPIVSLLPDGNLFLRFFVPEPEMAALGIGQVLILSCDGCPEGLSARVTYIAPEPEFTPPVIFSRDTRSKLVFLVEAEPNRPGGLHPGQPIEVAVDLGPAR